MPTAHIFDANATAWVAHNRFPHIQTKVFETRASHPWASVMLVQVAVGQGIDTHIHETETETAYILAGQGLFTHGGLETVLNAGMGVSIEPGLPHSLRNIGEEPLEVLAVHMPPIR
jgi:mannose-6-phosphate isomerase-like protein (cupin superfamily)